MDEIHVGFSGGKKATVIRVSGSQANHWAVWHRDFANPQTKADLHQAFRSMLSVAQHCVRRFSCGAQVDSDAILSLFQWHQQCETFCKREIIRLKSVRMTIPTPADYAGTQTVPFCTQAVQAVHQVIRQLVHHFVDTPDSPAEDQILAASKQGRKFSFLPFHADDLLHLVRIELDAFSAGESQTELANNDSATTMAGDVVLRNELTEEDRPSGEWADICGFSDDTFRNRMTSEKPGPTWRIVESGSQRYRIHLEDLPQKVRGSKKQRDEVLATIRR